MTLNPDQALGAFLLVLLGMIGSVLVLIMASTIRSVERPIERKRFVLEKITALFLGIYTILTGGIMYESIQQAALTRDSFTTVQRAFITIVDLQFEATRDAQGKATSWMFIPIIENSGSTPTKDMKVTRIMTGGPTKPEEGWSQSYPSIKLPHDPGDPDEVYYKPEPFHPTHLLLGPKARLPLPLSATGGIGVDLLRNVIERGWEHAAFGVIHYYDIFPGTKEHVTKFCFAIGAEKTTQNEIKPRYGVCRHWNCADEECRADRDAYQSEVRDAFAKAGQTVPRDIIDRWRTD
jgi:hypothetical protein